jgi:hypothetical protein
MEIAMRPSKAGAVVFILFGLMFLLPGLFFLWVMITKSPNATTSGALGGYVIGLLISAIGAGLIFAAVSGYRKMQRAAAAQEANPLSPWLWKRDWAARRADSQNKGKEILLWLLCIFVDTILLPISVSVLPDLISKSDPRALVLLAFDAAGLILLGLAARASLRHERFGKTYFELDSLPFSPGARLSGGIHLKLNILPERGVNLSLSCVRSITTGGGQDRTTTKVVLWQADKNIPASSISMDPLGRTIPVEFAIPDDAYVTDQNNSQDQVLWILHAQADLPGVNYSDDFEVPVFRTSSSTQVAADFAPSRFGFGASSDSLAADSGSAPSAPAHPRVVISSASGGTEFYFPPFRNPRRILILLLMTVIWSAFAYFLVYSNAPRVFALVFVIADLFLIWGCIRLCFGSARICVGNGEISSASRTLGIGSHKRFAISDIESIAPVTGGNQAGGDIYSIRLRTKTGKRVTLADEIAGRQEARWIVTQITSLAGLKVNQSVEIDAPLGVPAQPPQPVFGSSRVSSGGPAQSQ